VSRVLQAIEKKRGTKCQWDPSELLEQKSQLSEGRRPADSLGMQRRHFGEDKIPDTRERIACQYGLVK